jgi:hypothetical protein
MSHLNLGRYQFVLWRRWWWPLVRNIGPYPSSGKNRGALYRWRVLVGPLEIRCFTGRVA